MLSSANGKDAGSRGGWDHALLSRRKAPDALGAGHAPDTRFVAVPDSGWGLDRNRDPTRRWSFDPGPRAPRPSAAFGRSIRAEALALPTSDTVRLATRTAVPARLAHWPLPFPPPSEEGGVRGGPPGDRPPARVPPVRDASKGPKAPCAQHLTSQPPGSRRYATPAKARRHLAPSISRPDRHVRDVRTPEDIVPPPRGPDRRSLARHADGRSRPSTELAPRPPRGGQASRPAFRRRRASKETSHRADRGTAPPPTEELSPPESSEEDSEDASPSPRRCLAACLPSGEPMAGPRTGGTGAPRVSSRRHRQRRTRRSAPESPRPKPLASQSRPPLPMPATARERLPRKPPADALATVSDRSRRLRVQVNRDRKTKTELISNSFDYGILSV